MKKERKYYDFYVQCMLDGEKLPKYLDGLCEVFGEDDKYLSLFTPTYEDCIEYGVYTWFYWADDGFTKASYFGETRQTIVLFLAAMHEEL